MIRQDQTSSFLSLRVSVFEVAKALSSTFAAFVDNSTGGLSYVPLSAAYQAAALSPPLRATSRTQAAVTVS